MSSAIHHNREGEEMTNPASRPASLATRAWARLVRIDVDVPLQDELRVRFLLAVLVAVSPLIAVLGFVVLPFTRAESHPHLTAVFLAALAGVPFLGVAYFLARRGRIDEAANITIVVCIAGPWLASFTHYEFVMFMMVGVALGFGVSNSGPTFRCALLPVLGTAARPLFGDVRFDDMVPYIGFNTMMPVVLLLLGRYVEGLETARTRALEDRNALLQRSQSELGALVQERTRELEAVHAELLVKERLAALGELVAVVSHELRNPLGTIRNTVYGLRQRADREPDAAIDRLERNVARCSQIIEELLDFTRPVKVVHRRFDLDALVHEAVDEHVKPAEVKIRYESGGVGSVVGDRDNLRRAIVNALNNAIDAAVENAEAVPPLVEVRTASAGGFAEIVVSDTGKGVPTELRDWITQPLSSTKSFGVGLGLPIMKRILEAHGGGLDLESSPGRLTVARLWFPAGGAPSEHRREPHAAFVSQPEAADTLSAEPPRP